MGDDKEVREEGEKDVMGGEKGGENEENEMNRRRKEKVHVHSQFGLNCKIVIRICLICALRFLSDFKSVLAQTH